MLLLMLGIPFLFSVNSLVKTFSCLKSKFKPHHCKAFLSHPKKANYSCLGFYIESMHISVLQYYLVEFLSLRLRATQKKGTKTCSFVVVLCFSVLPECQISNTVHNIKSSLIKCDLNGQENFKANFGKLSFQG